MRCIVVTMMQRVVSPGLVLLVVLLFKGIQLCMSTNSTLGWIHSQKQMNFNLKQSFKHSPNRKSISRCIEREREILTKLERSFQEWPYRWTNWSGEDCCEWRGVTCNAITDHVVELDLRARDMFLFAREVDSCLAELKHLEYLDLSGNYFYGIRIPDFFGSFKNLKYLNLSQSGFGGKIPPKLGNLSSLQVLDISSPYSYTGFQLHTSNLRWASTLSSLEHLDMSGANFSEAFDLMPVLSQLPSLLHLTLKDSGIQNIHFSTSSINSTFLSRVQTLDLSSNLFVGSLPKAFHNMTSLSSLYISHNKFNSSVPLSSVPKSLLNLDLSGNKFDRVEGGLISIINKACSAKSLDLSHNNFGTEVLVSNKSLWSCVNGYDLEFLSLENNKIGGNIPDWFGQLTNLKHLRLGADSLSGPIPSSFGKLSKLRVLDLTDNQLNDPIPHSLGSLLALESLDLSHNQLIGSIPKSLSGLVSLRALDLSHNQLIGSIPKSLSGLVSLRALDLSNNKLSGHVPESIGQLVNLVGLDISHNSLDGVFSQLHLANLSKLYTITISSNHMTCNFKSDWIPPFNTLDTLNMSSCFIGPYFPMWIQTLHNIWVLDLLNSNITGVLPTWPQPVILNYLDLSNNQIITNPLANIADNFPDVVTLLIGNNLILGSIPNSLCKLVRLQVLDLSKNDLSGEIPRCWEEMQSLFVINLSSNKFSGSIPTSFGQLSNLKRLHVNKNKLQGELSQALRNCTNLELLDLGENYFSGSIETWIGNSLSSLRILRLRKNMLNGRIPRQICDLHRLQFLDLAHNNLIGDIPRCFANLHGMSSENSISIGPAMGLAPSIDAKVEPPVAADDDPEWIRERLSVATKGSDLEFTKLQLQLLEIMDLSSNKLTGVIPDELCFLSGLHGLNLSYNQLSGNIPNQIGDMKSLETLDLSNNQLFGPIPQNLSALYSLSHLNLSNNDLSGRIPEGNQLRTLTDPSIYGGNSKLCGDLQLKKCVQPPISPGHENGDNRDVTKKDKIFFWFVVTTGYTLGLWGVIGILVFKNNWRLAYFQFVDDKKEWVIAMIAIKVARLKLRMQRT